MNKYQSVQRTITRTGQRNGGEILIAALRCNGADRMFGVPGESALPIFDALYEEDSGVRFVVCRHEGTASHMAEADAKISGRPGICVVSRGPGAMQAAIGLHTAWQDSTPMILIVGQVPSGFRGREAFQEMDYVRTFDDMTKWVAEVNSVDRIPELVSRAFHVAMQGRPGPVVLSIPEDVLSATSDVADAAPATVIDAAPSASQMAEVEKLLGQAKRPLVIVGNLGWTPEAAAKFRAFVERNDLPVVAGFRSQDVLDNCCEQYIGDISLGCSRPLMEHVKASDLLLVVGDRLGDVTTNHYSLFDVPTPNQVLIHVFPGPDELGRVYVPTLGIPARSSRFAEALAELNTLESSGWAAWRAKMRKAYVDYQMPRTDLQSFDLAKVISHLNDALPDNAVITNGAGNYTIWLHRYYRYRRLGTQIAPKSGSMGYGLPAAIAAQLRYPERKVICLAGDGCFMMASQEFATAVQQHLPIVIIIVNNAMYGSIRMHQELNFPHRPSGTDLLNPDFAALARCYGAFGEAIERHEDFPGAFARALEAGKPAIIELRVNRMQITPDRVLSKDDVAHLDSDA
ncbi:thiamine pyrophosphate-binding protein [Tardiphaga sp.]|uniref:thiamine pyrophosphate-binding protein n=1 Tax=Tardiphaga sp. TaxID=1926292 RepID=UPI002617EA71|nr:thiamine pyrophosphate-binding protein [Tardiphaga sp.]MDB5619306.1 thiamine pyrophosphate-binding protein [Tardiphaga sp.]